MCSFMNFFSKILSQTEKPFSHIPNQKFKQEFCSRDADFVWNSSVSFTCSSIHTSTDIADDNLLILVKHCIQVTLETTPSWITVPSFFIAYFWHTRYHTDKIIYVLFLLSVVSFFPFGISAIILSHTYSTMKCSMFSFDLRMLYAT